MSDSQFILHVPCALILCSMYLQNYNRCFSHQLNLSLPRLRSSPTLPCQSQPSKGRSLLQIVWPPFSCQYVLPQHVCSDSQSQPSHVCGWSMGHNWSGEFSFRICMSLRLFADAEASTFPLCYVGRQHTPGLANIWPVQLCQLYSCTGAPPRGNQCCCRCRRLWISQQRAHCG
jgi:hypothetical protein